MNMKKYIKPIVYCSFLFLLLYFGIFRKGFSYYTGIGTSYSYFAAQKAIRDSSVLVYYSQGLVHHVYSGNIDSLQKEYGFSNKDGVTEVSSIVLKIYNLEINKAIHKRLGEIKWKEYQFKRDSMAKKYEIKLIEKPH